MIRVAPFAGACLLAWASVLIATPSTWWEYWTSLALVLIAAAMALLTPIFGRYPWIALVPSALMLMSAAGLLRASAGGSSSGLGAMALLPIFQIALYSRLRRDVGIVLIGLVLFTLLPIWLVGAPAYPSGQYRAGLVTVVIYALVALATQSLVADIRERAYATRAREQMLEQVNSLVHGLFDSPHPRRDVCEQAMAISSATSAVLYEPSTGSEQLTCTATAGVADAAVLQSAVRSDSPAYAVMKSRRPALIVQAAGSSNTLEPWSFASGRCSLLYQPLLRAGLPLGVLVIGWPDYVVEQGPRASVVALLAHEAATVISHADTLDQLSDEALTDALTGLPNRRAWDRHVRHLSSVDQQLAVAIIDLDQFKQFNDVHGHPAGDRLLRETAAQWRSELRSQDFLARIGGEEFGLLLSGCEAPDALALVDQLRRRVTHDRTCSAGVTIKPLLESLPSAIERADGLLYEAKNRGRDQCVLAQELTS